MKRLLVILFSVLLLACGRQQEPVDEQPLPFTFDENLQQIDSLLQHNADSALMCLTSFRPTEGSGEISSTFNANYQSLLLSEALYKTYNPQLNRHRGVETYGRTSLHEAIDYFDSLYAGYPKNDDLAMLSARSHYMNGVGFYEYDSVVDACKEYLHTLEIMEDHFDTEKLTGYKAKFMGLTYTRLGEVFSYNVVSIPAIYSYKQAIKCFLSLPNYSLANTYRAIGLSYQLDNNKDSALYYYRKSIYLAREQNKLSIYYGALTEVSPLYYDLNYKDSAFMMIKEALSLPCSEDARLAQYYSIGSLYAKENMYDSAIIYLEQSIKRNSYATQTSSAELLMNCYQALGDTVKASYYKGIYGNNFSKYRNNAEITTELNKLYDGYYDKIIQKDSRLEAKQQHRRIIFTLLLSLIVISTIIYIFTRKTIETKNSLLQKDRDLAEMKRKLKANTLMDENICHYILDIVNKVQFKSKVGFEHYKEYALNKDQLLALRDAVDKHYDYFTLKLVENYPKLSYDDINYCCLYLLGLKDADISAMMQRAYPSVCQRNRKLKSIFNSTNQIPFILWSMINDNLSQQISR